MKQTRRLVNPFAVKGQRRKKLARNLRQILFKLAMSKEPLTRFEISRFTGIKYGIVFPAVKELEYVQLIESIPECKMPERGKRQKIPAYQLSFAGKFLAPLLTADLGSSETIRSQMWSLHLEAVKDLEEQNPFIAYQYELEKLLTTSAHYQSAEEHLLEYYRNFARRMFSTIEEEGEVSDERCAEIVGICQLEMVRKDPGVYPRPIMLKALDNLPVPSREFVEKYFSHALAMEVMRNAKMELRIATVTCPKEHGPYENAVSTWREFLQSPWQCPECGAPLGIYDVPKAVTAKKPVRVLKEPS